MSSNSPIERTLYGILRMPAVAAHVDRYRHRQQSSPDDRIRVPVNSHREAIKNPTERGPRVFDPEERSNRRSKTKTHEPTARGSAPSGDLFWSRLLRAPQDQGEYWGRLLLVTFLGEARKVTGPARP